MRRRHNAVIVLSLAALLLWVTYELAQLWPLILASHS